MARQLQQTWSSDIIARGAKDLLKKAGNESTDLRTRIEALHELSESLEAEERKYEEVTGDVMVNMRSQQPIGAFLSAVKDEEEIYDEIYESWIHDRHASLEQRVAAMRFFLACLSAWQFQSPLTEPDFVTGLQEWATTEVAKRPSRGASEHTDEESLLLEARRTYATGLLAIALTRTEVCDEAVRSGTVAQMVQDLAHMGLGDCGSEDEDHTLASSSTCDMIAADSQPQPDVALIREEQASSNPAQGCEGWEELRARRQRYVVQCLGSFGEYMECLALVLAADGVAVMARLLHAWREQPTLLADLLRLLVALLVHRRFAELFVDSGGVQLLLSLPHNKHTFVGLSFAFFGMASVPLAVERVCALPAAVVEELVERALSLLTCGYDPARKNVALFFGAAIHFRGILDVFDRVGGLPRLLDAMRTVLLLLHAPVHGENRAEKQVAFHASAALRQYFRTHLVLHVATLKRRYCGHAAVKQGASAAERTVDVSAESVDAAVSAVENDRRVGEAFVRERWPPLEKFIHCGGPGLMLDFVQHTPGERYCNEIARHALEIMQIATLMPECRRTLLTGAASQASGQSDGIAAILEAAHGQAYLNDPEVMQPALVVVANCVTVPSSLAHLMPPPDKAPGRRKLKAALPAPLFTPQPAAGSSMDLDLQSTSSAEGDLVAVEMREGYARARQAVRRAAGIRMLLGLLHARSSMPAGQVDRLRALAVRCLLGLAHDPQLRHILAKLQVWRLLAQLVHEPDRGTVGSGGAARRLIGSDGSSHGGSSLATFNSLAIDLINLTSAGLGKAGAAAAASDAVAPALHKIERAAIAASTHITYAPSELLVLIEDHLRASGLHASANALAAEAALGGSQPSLRAEMQGDAQQPHLITPFSNIRASAPAESPFTCPGTQPSVPKRRALAIAPSLIRSIVKAPVAAKEPIACIEEIDALNDTSAQPDECTPANLPAIPDAANADQLPGSAAIAAHTMQSRRKRRASESLISGSLQRQRCSGGAQPEQPCAAGAEECLTGTLRVAAPAASYAELPLPHASTPLAEAATPARPRGLFGASGAHERPGGTPAAAEPAGNPLLLNLPCRRATLEDIPQPAKACSTPALTRATVKQAISSPPDRKGRGAGTDPPVASKLSSIVMQYLRHQHKAACLKAAAPISTLPPMSLLRPNTLPQAKRTLEAPTQVHRRLLRRSVTDPHGGWGGRRQDRHFVYSRFRHVRTVRDEDSAVYRSCAFLGDFAALALGSHSGEIRIHDTLSGDLIDTLDAHDTPAYQLRVHEARGRSLLLSSSRNEARLWDVGACSERAGGGWTPAEYITEPLHTCGGMRNAIFRPDGRLLAGLMTAGRGQDPLLFDLGSETYSTISMSTEGWRSKGQETLCFNPTGELLLFGPTLWDPRAPRCLHVFDLLSYSACCSSFHPGGLEAVVNSEVWDLRTLKLQRCVPCLDSTSLTWNASGDCAYATLRRPSDDLGALLHPKRAKHPLHAAFRTVDSTDFSEIGTISTEGRCVLDLCVDAADNFIGLVTLEPNELMSCSARVYEVGRRRMQDDESDLEDGDEDDEDEDDDDEEDDEEGAQLITGGPSGSSSAADASADGDGEEAERGSENSEAENSDDDADAGSGSEAGDDGEGESEEEEEGSGDEGMELGEEDNVEGYVRLMDRLREMAEGEEESGLDSEFEAHLDSDSDSD